MRFYIQIKSTYLPNPMAIGRYLIQARFISISYRYRGRVVRTQTHTNTNLHVKITNTRLNLLLAPNTRLNKADMKKILPYSAMNNSANPTLPYSILNPETNSDSPSAKSNGVRFVSASEMITHSPRIGKKISILVQ